MGETRGGPVGQALRAPGRARGVAARGWGLLLLAWLASAPAPAASQAPLVLVEQAVAVGAGGLVSGALDPTHRYTLQFLAFPEGVAFRGTLSQNWFAREGAPRFGASDTPLRGRAPAEHELGPPAPALSQWTFAATVWNDGGGTLVVRLVDHGGR